MGRSAGLGRKDSLYRTVAGIGEPDLYHPEDFDLRSDVGSVSVPFSLRLACDGAITVALAPPRGDQEAALLDLLGQFLGVPVAALLGAGQQRTA